jgi:thiamine transporter ThiT
MAAAAAQVWLVSRRHVSQLAGSLTAVNVVYLSLLWTVTGNMATPLVAGLLHAALEVWYGEHARAGPAHK